MLPAIIMHCKCLPFRRLSPATPTSPSAGSTLSSVPLPFSPRPSSMKQQGMRTRRFFNEDYSYIMDAKTRGNLGRYINVRH